MDGIALLTLAHHVGFDETHARTHMRTRGDEQRRGIPGDCDVYTARVLHCIENKNRRFIYTRIYVRYRA